RARCCDKDLSYAQTSNAAGDERWPVGPPAMPRPHRSCFCVAVSQRRETCHAYASPCPVFLPFSVSSGLDLSLLGAAFVVLNHRVANFSAHWIGAVVCIAINNVKIAPIVIASPVN